MAPLRSARLRAEQASGRAVLQRLVLRALAAFVFLAPLAAEATTDLRPAAQFFPKDTAASVGPTEGTPPAAAVRSGDGRLLGYAFSTREVSGSVGYSGRPLDIVAAVTPEGIVAGAVIVAHEEPILVIGIPREQLAAYVADFRGFDVGARESVRPAAGGRRPQPVAGASVTSAVIRDAIVRSARAVLRPRAAPAVAEAAAGRPRLDRETLRDMSWPDLVSGGALRRITVPRGEAARRLGTQDSEPDKTFVELWLALATPPAIGESIAGRRAFESLIGKMGGDDELVFIGATGLYSFMGTDWRRSGTFDRIQLVQGEKTIRLRAEHYTRIERLRATGAPDLREAGLFRVPAGSGFDPTAPFRLDLVLAAGAAAPAPAAVVTLDYRIPEQFLVRPASPPPAQADAAAPAQPEALPLSQAPLWQDIWHARRFEVAGLSLMLVTLAGILIFQNAVTSRTVFYERMRVGFLLVTLVFLGLYANGQLSVVNVITFVHALLSGFRWELFLLDPIAFILWGFVAISLLFWGRGVFCGWLCPFGALQELSNGLARRLGIRQIAVPFLVHERLWMIKYVIFLGLFAVSLHSIMAAFTFAEVEPFKTAITLKFMRDWPFVVYAVLLIAAGLFVERLYCRYLCPLGAALAIPARLRMFDWLKRYRECGGECQICAHKCTVQAIHPLGQINPNECIYCLKCQANYLDPTICLHLKKRAERRRPQAVTTPAEPSAPATDRAAHA